MVAFPAKVLRCRDNRLVPAVVAADINAQPESAKAWRAWPLRYVPDDQASALARATDELAKHRADLRRPHRHTRSAGCDLDQRHGGWISRPQRSGRKMIMPPRRNAQPMLPVPSTMKELKDTLWKAADKLRGSMDASQYKDVILGLVFLKYVSDAFDERRDADPRRARRRGHRRGADRRADRRPRRVHRARRVLGAARRAVDLPRRERQGQPAMAEPASRSASWSTRRWTRIMAANPTLTATLPRIYNRDNVDQRRLGELLDLFNSARFTGQGASKARDLLGEVYEYFLEKFATAEGKRGGEFYTPAGVVRVLVEVLEPTTGRVYDPCCGSGGMFVQTEKFLEAHDRRRHGHLGLRPGAQRAHLADGEDEPRHPRPRTPTSAPTGATRSPATSTRADRRKARLRHGQPAVQHQGLGPQRVAIRAGSTACRRPATPTTPGSSTSSPSSRPAVRPAW